MPTVSVVVPVYNGEATLAKTLESILNQTFSDLEVVVIDDGSTDGTLAVLSNFKDPRIKIFSYENGGLPVARNRGINRATGEFISFIDADDLWSIDKLEQQVQALNHHPQAGVAYSWTAFVDEQGEFLYARESSYLEGDVYPQLLVRNFISSGSNILVRRSVIETVGLFDPQLQSVEDWEYYLRLATHCHFAVVKQHQIFYRKSSRSMATNIPVMEVASLTVIERSFAKAPAHLQGLKAKSLSNLYRYLAKQCIGYACRPEELKVARQKLQQAIQYYPGTLMQRETQRLMIKVLALSLLPRHSARSLIELLGDKFPMVRY
ncbi:MAG: glycosyl transferase family A [Leptolyngbya sp.]|nr:MAG: glycosyl transferase family A [Leptolyngbya sp.]